MCVLGLGLLLAWTNITFFSRLIHFSTRSGISHLNTTYAYACLGMGAMLLVCSLPWVRRRVAAWLGRASLACACLMVLGTFLLTLVEARLFTQPWCSIISTVVGMSLGVLSLAWAQSLMAEQGRLAWTLCLAFAVGGALHVAVLALPVSAAKALTIVMPLLSLAVLVYESRSGRRAGLAGVDAGSGSDAGEGPVPADRPSPFGRQAFRGRVARALVAMLFIGLAEGLERSLFMSLSPSTETEAYHLALLLSAVIGVGFFALALAVCAKAGHMYWLNRIVTATISLLFLLAPIVYGIGLAGDVITLTCHYLFQMLVWLIFVRTDVEYRVPAWTTFAPGMGMANLGSLAGTFLGSLVRSFTTLEPRLVSLLALVSASLVMVSLMFLFDEQTLVQLTNTDDERPAAPRRFGMRLEEVAQTYGLSRREAEVMTLIAKGRTAQRVQEELGISQGTVNTHLAHIYKKLDIHDRQELLDILEERAG